MQLIHNGVQVRLDAEAPVRVEADGALAIIIGRPADDIRVTLNGDPAILLATLRSLGLAVADAILELTPAVALQEKVAPFAEPRDLAVGDLVRVLSIDGADDWSGLPADARVIHVGPKTVMVSVPSGTGQFVGQIYVKPSDLELIEEADSAAAGVGGLE